MHNGTRNRIAGLLFLVTTSALGRPPAEATDWRVGLARVDITPSQPLVMAGYGARVTPFEKVGSGLSVKVLVLADGQGHRAALVTSDLLGFTAAIAEPICGRLRERTGLLRKQILINSSHTHTGPLLSLQEPRPDDPAAADARRTVEYTRRLQDRVVQAVEQALAALEPAELAWGSGVVHFAMNRREFTSDRVILGDNPRGLADRSVPVLAVSAPDGRLRAVVFGAAAHNTTLRSDWSQISGDYAGFAQEHIEGRHPGGQAMFLLGCAGDADPYPRGTIDEARRHGETLGAEVCRVLADAGKLRPLAGRLQVAFATVDAPLDTSPSRDDLVRWATERGNPRGHAARQMVACLERGEPLAESYACPLAVWQIGDLTLVGLSGEVVVDYVPLLENELGHGRLWLAAYCNDVFGYLPSERVLAEGGYETRGLYAGAAGFFAPGVQRAVVDGVRDLALTVGRRAAAVPASHDRAPIPAGLRP